MGSWTAVRLIRWPAQRRDREWCLTHDLPRVLLVQGEHPMPAAGPHEIVLADTAAAPVIAAAVDQLAYAPDTAAAWSFRGWLDARRTAGEPPAPRCARRPGY